MTNIRIVLFLFKFNCIMCPFFSQWVPNTCGQLFWSEPPQPLIVIFVNNGNANKKWMPDLDRNKFNLTHDFYSLIGPKIDRLKRRCLLVFDVKKLSVVFVVLGLCWRVLKKRIHIWLRPNFSRQTSAGTVAFWSELWSHFQQNNQGFV